MKFLFSLFAIFMLTESCSSSKEAATNSEEMVTTSKAALPESKKTNEMTNSKNDVVADNYDSSITYKALSRGSFEFVQVSKSKVMTSSDSGLKNIDTHTCPEKDWEELDRLLNAVDLEGLQKLKAPTSKRLFDGAAHATLEIQVGDIIYVSPSFDHGAPPEAIKELVNKVLSVRESAIKQ